MILLTRGLAVLVFIFFTGCDANEESVMTILSIDVSEAKPLHIKDWFSNITYQPLQSVKGSYLSEIGKVRISDEGIYILEDLSPVRRLVIFNRDGTFRGILTNPGEGPGKYLGVFDFWVDESNGTIELLDRTQGKIVVFDFTGNYARDIRLPVTYQEFVKLSEDDYVFYAGNSLTSNNKDNLHFYNNKTGISKTYLPIPAFLAERTADGYSFSFNQSDGRYLFAEPFSNIIYSFNQKSTSFLAAFQVDLGDQWLDGDLFEQFKRYSGAFEGVELLNNSGKVYDFRLLGNFGDVIFFSFFLQQRLYLCRYNVNRKSYSLVYCRYGDRRPNDYDLGLPLFYLCSIYHDNLVFFIYPHELKNHLSDLMDTPARNDLDQATKERFKVLDSMAAGLAEEDNPVLVFATLKEE